jgi:hypothetical protein
MFACSREGLCFTERMFEQIPLTFHFPALYFQLSVEHIFYLPSYHPSLSGFPGGRRNGLPPRPPIRPTPEYVGHTLCADRRTGRAGMGRLSRTRLCMGYRPEAAQVGQESFFTGIPVNLVNTVKVFTPVRASQSKVRYRSKDHRVGAHQTTPRVVRVRPRFTPMIAETEREPVSGIALPCCPANQRDRIRRVCAP